MRIEDRAIAKYTKKYLLYLGAFHFYYVQCQFQFPEQVEDFCKILIKDWASLPDEIQDHIGVELRIAWEKEKDYGKDSPTLSPFGNNQKCWYSVVEVALEVKTNV